MTNPITPPPELVQQWQDESPETQIADHIQYLATRAAQWGADQELEACVNWLIENQNPRWAHVLRAARRPKPPSLKEQALEALAAIEGDFNTVGDRAATIRRALEALND